MHLLLVGCIDLGEVVNIDEPIGVWALGLTDREPLLLLLLEFNVWKAFQVFVKLLEIIDLISCDYLPAFLASRVQR
jgi:hypothetical protein